MNPYRINSAVMPRRFAEPDKASQDNKRAEIQDMLEEVSWSEQDVLQSYMPFAANPDPVVRAKGLKIYCEMEKDDQIKAATEMRIQSRLSTKWEIKPGNPGNAKSEEMSAFVNHSFKRMQGTFEEDLEQIYSAIAYGFSISELVYQYLESGPFQGKIGLRSIKTREPYNYDFKIDAHGNLLGIVYTGPRGRDKGAEAPDRGIIQPSSVLGSITGSMLGQNPSNLGTYENPFNPSKFIVYTYNKRFENWYGRSDYLAAFPWWIMKKHGRKFWAIWLERYAAPFLYAQYKRDAGLKKEQLQRVDDFIRTLSARQGIRLSDAWTLTPVEFSGQGADTYEKSTESFNRFIARSILMPNLMGFTQQPNVGSYSLGQKHFDAFVWILNKMGRDTSEMIVGEQIIRPLIAVNYGEVEDDLLPQFEFTAVDDESVDKRSQIITRLGQFGFLDVNEDWVRKYLSLPEKDPGIVLIDPKKVSDRSENEDLDDDKDEGGDFSSRMLFKESENRDLTVFEEKVRVKKFEAAMDSAVSAMESDLSRELGTIRDDIIDQVKRKGIIASGDASEVSKVVVNVKDIKRLLEAWITKIQLDSALGQLEELGRAGIEVEIKRRFQSFSAQVMESWEPLPPAEAIDFFGRKVTAYIITKAGKKKIIDIASGVDISFIRQRAFTIAGIIHDDILNDAKQIILNGIKRESEVETVEALKDMFNKYLDQGEELDEELLKPHRLQTIVRTNTTEAINQGRRSMITDPDVGEFVQYFQYAAILDGRTTDYCRCMDSKVFRIDSVAQIQPPAHYNCRSFTVPVTQFEVDDLRKSGRGVQISEPCQGRMSGFSEMK